MNILARLCGHAIICLDASDSVMFFYDSRALINLITREEREKILPYGSFTIDH